MFEVCLKLVGVEMFVVLDFDSVFGAGGEESDVDLFGSSASTAGKAAKVSAADAESRIKSFDFTL